MTLTSGARLGPYEILGALGAGGMGEVYKARDTRLGRTVAIKVLPSDAASDPERRRRFEQEARAISALNHPHICVLHDVGHDGDTHFLVMEYLEGQTLGHRLRKGPLPIAQALEVGTQIADALAKAHRSGIVHRDLKPANVMLAKDGAKLLDFGLARLRAQAGLAPAGTTELATATVGTTPGTIMGTVPYMAPEQLEGKDCDSRTDLFAFGCVLYEMLTGRRAFSGDSEARVISAIMASEPPSIAALQPLTPPLLDRLVRQCLAKIPDDRPDSAHDVANELRWLQEGSGIGAAPDWGPARRRLLRTALLLACVALLVGAVAGVGIVWFLRPPRAMMARLSIEIRPAEDLKAGVRLGVLPPAPGGSRTALAWTPDGQTLLFVGRRGQLSQLYARRLDATEAKPLPGTEGAQVLAVSPDGQWVAFWAARALKKVPVAGGLAMDLATGMVDPPGGLVWDARAGLVFSGEAGPIWAVPAGGGKPVAITKVGQSELEHILPSLLPGGRVLLYTVRKRTWTWGDEEVVAQVLATGERKRLLTDAVDARYAPATGHLVFLRRGVLNAVSFDDERLELRGTPTPMLDGIAQALTAGQSSLVTGAGQFALATTGTLAWLPAQAAPLGEKTLVTVDRRGQVAPLPAPVRNYAGHVRVSPDGRRLAVTDRTLTEVGLWLYDLTRTTLTRVPVEGEVNVPTWTPDGRQLVFEWHNLDIAAQPADGTTPPRVLGRGFYPSSWAPDGRTLAALRDDDVHMVTIAEGTAGVQPLWQTAQVEEGPAFSPDGRWLVYGSNVSGRQEIYVRPYPGPGPEEQVSIDGGQNPAWHPAGRELFFVGLRDAAGKRRMMSADFVSGFPPRIGRPRPLFEFDSGDLGLSCTPVRCYDVAPDGQRFYAVHTRLSPPQPPVTHVNLIQNWFEELKAKVPPAR